MHQYKIIYTDYTEEGAPTNIRHHVYADNAEQASVRFAELDAMRYEEGGKMYKVQLQVCVYKTVEEPAAFFAQFQM